MPTKQQRALLCPQVQIYLASHVHPQRQAVLTHLAACLACQCVQREFAEVRRMVRSLPDLHMRDGLPPQVLAAWRENEGASE